MERLSGAGETVAPRNSSMGAMGRWGSFLYAAGKNFKKVMRKKYQMYD
jgi:hypothetical protein